MIRMDGKTYQFVEMCSNIISSLFYSLNDEITETMHSQIRLFEDAHRYQGCSPRPTPPRPAKSKPCPALPAEIDKTHGAQRGKADCRLHRLCPHIWAKNGEENEMKEKLFIWSFVQLVIIWFAERPFKSQRM